MTVTANVAQSAEAAEMQKAGINPLAERDEDEALRRPKNCWKRRAPAPDAAEPMATRPWALVPCRRISQ